MSELKPAPDRSDRLNERFSILRDRYGYSVLDRVAFDDFIAQPGACLVLFAEDPQKIPETWDLTIILPEGIKTVAVPLRIGLLPPADARTLAVRYGIRIWPALLGLRDGAYLGVIEGLKDWGVYAQQIPELLAAEPARPPSIGIAVQTAGTASACH
jgi:hydrogenase-1 operon protein HyaE